MAEQNLRLGHDVIADAQEHERRLNGRDRGLVFVGEPTWTDVERRRAGFAPWSDEVLEFDTAVRTSDEISDAITALLCA